MADRSEGRRGKPVAWHGGPVMQALIWPVAALALDTLEVGRRAA